MFIAVSRASRRVVALALAGGVIAVSVVPSLAAPGGAHTAVGLHSVGAPASNAAFRRHFYRGQHDRHTHHGAGIQLGRGLGYGAAAAAGAGIAGLALGGAFVDDVAATAVTPMDEAMAYCADRFRSYDPSTGTYVGYDGVARACP